MRDQARSVANAAVRFSRCLRGRNESHPTPWRN
jgi:hypothetical protein